MPNYQVADRQSISISAPAAEAFSAAAGLDIQASPLVRGVFRGRELLLGSHAGAPFSKPLFDWAESLGWVRLANMPGREVVFGAVTRPWEANVVFRGIPAGQFATFMEPGYVKIVWNLRVEARGEIASVASTETRVQTTSPDARSKFRRYWAIFSPGIVLIRLAALRILKRNAERRTAPSTIRQRRAYL